MPVGDRVIGTIRFLLEVNDRIKNLAVRVDALAVETRDIDRRLIRIEGWIEAASSGGFRPDMRRLEPPAS